MKADAIARARPTPPGGSGGELEHGARVEVDARGAPRPQLLHDGDHPALSVQEDRIDGVAHSEGMDGAAGLDPQALALGEGRAEEEAAQPREEGAGAFDALAEPRARGLVFGHQHVSTLT